MVDRILISSDFLRANAKEQHSNCPWLHHILKRPIEKATSIAPILFASTESLEEGLSREQFFRLSNCSRFDSTINQFYFTAEEISAESLQYLSIFIRPDDLVIGYELSKGTKNLLDRIGAKWIDIWLHPVRYLDDILLAFTASDPDVYAEIARFNVPESVYELYADLYGMNTRRMIDKGRITGIAPDSALFVGQTLNDVSICRDGEMLSILNFKEQIERTAQEYNAFYYSRHPYVKRGDEDILRYIRKIGMLRTDIPSYTLISSGLVKKVVSISSSVLHEAKYFGVETECLFEPVLRLGGNFHTDHLSVFQDFVSPHFWEAVLRPLLPVNQCRETRFLVCKDKLRDALMFYWSYKDVDKVESMRHRVDAMQRQIGMIKKSASSAGSPATRKKFNPFEAGAEAALQVPWENVEKDFLNKIAACKIVSFDIFETLIERCLDYPKSLFELMQEEARSIVGCPSWNFLEDRQKARGMVKNGAHGEEITLGERYEALATERGFGDGMSQALLNMELGYERRLCRPRLAGKRLFDLAKKQGKRIILVSDTYFERDFVFELLKNAGYTGFTELFVSSDTGMLKSTGRMFRYIISVMQVKASDICHVGDNNVSDITRAREAGYEAFHLPWHSEQLKKTTMFHRSGALAFGNGSIQSAVRYLVSRRLYDVPAVRPSSGSQRDGRAADFGYSVLGVLFLGFAGWTMERAIDENITDLYFLSRDGDIAKKCYDIISRENPAAPKSHYLRVSRRSLFMAAIRNVDDVRTVLSQTFTPTTIDTLLKNRFDMPPVANDILVRIGVHDRNIRLSHMRNDFILNELAEIIGDEIVEKAKAEREVMMEYFASQGLDGNSRQAAVVDIGHRGTLQKLLTDILGNPEIRGYYFATQREAADEGSESVPCSAYLCENIDPGDKGHFYNTYLPMFESIFINDEDSLIRVKREGESFGFDCLNSDDDARKKLAANLHKGVVEFCQDAVAVFAELGLKPALESDEAVNDFLSVLKAPAHSAASLFQSIEFEREFSCAGRLPLFLFQGKRYNEAKSLWKEGVQALNRQLHRQGLKHRTQAKIYKILKLGIKKFGNDSQYARFVDSPYSTLADSRRWFLRVLSTLLA